MNTRIRPAIALLYASAALSAVSAGATNVLVGTPAQGAAVIRGEDSFTAALSPADISIRLRRPEGGNVADVLAVYAGEVLPWSAEDNGRLEAMVARNAVAVAALSRWLPDEVLLLRNSHRIDGGLAHTRANAIFFGPKLPDSEGALDTLFFHELFHVLSRANPGLHDELYGIIGFRRCASLALPPALRDRIVTNPDAPVLAHVAPRSKEGGTASVTPVLLGSPSRWSPAKTAFGSYFQLQFLAVERAEDGTCTVTMQDDSPVMLPPKDASQMILEHAGRNTTYLLHPEELVADNFAQLLTGRTDVPDAWTHAKLAAVLGLPAAGAGGAQPEMDSSSRSD